MMLTATGRPRLIVSWVVAVAAAAVALGPGLAAPAMAASSQPTSHAALQTLAPPGMFDWGDEIAGELGNGVYGNNLTGSEANQADSPVSIPLPAGVRQLVAASYDGVALLSNGTVAVWGDNTQGQLGDGSQNARVTPYVIPSLTGIAQVAEDGNHALALDSSGAVWVWGLNLSGEAGNGTRGTNILAPQRVPGLSGVVQVAAGGGSDYALKSDGTVWAWGYNAHGELGDDTTLNRLYPSQVPGLTGITKIAAGGGAAFAIRADGSVMAWGNNNVGSLGNGTNTGMAIRPVQVPGLTGVTQISVGDGRTFALTGTSGTVWAWGSNPDGELGDGTTAAHYSPEQIGLTGVSQIGAGDVVTVAILSSGSVLSWGSNSEGELGIGSNDKNPHPSPVLVRTLAGGSLAAAGASYAMVIASPAPRIPSVIDETQAGAAQILQAAGYVLGHVATVVDITCQYVGVVKTQSPAAGTVDPPGTAVNVTIGKAGGKCLG